MHRRLTDARDKVLGRIAASASAAAGKGFPGDPDSYIRHCYRNVAIEDLRERDAGDLAGAALAHLDFAMERRRGRPKIRLFNPAPGDPWESPHTIVQLVNDDMPFLVDSVGMALIDAGLHIHLTVHPIYKVRRDGKGRILEIHPRYAEVEDTRLESFIHIEVDREVDPTALRRMSKVLQSVLRDVRAAVRDWAAMGNKAREIVAQLREQPPALEIEALEEGIAFLEWLEQDNFTFLGYREYELIRDEQEDSLQAITGSGLGILRRSLQRQARVVPRTLAPGIRKQARSRDLLILTKANSRSTVHRPIHLDYVGIKTFDKAGRVNGEKRFLGLYTSAVYNCPPRQIPLLRYKIDQVMRRSELIAESHAGKALQHILDTYPRDELFQTSIEDLTRIAGRIFALQERQRVKLFLRRDEFRRFISCLVYVPREKYNTQVRNRIESILQQTFHGTSVEHAVQLDASNLARLHILVRVPAEASPRFNIQAVEAQLAEAIRTWGDKLRDALVEHFEEAEGLRLSRIFGPCFPAAYEEDFSPAEAVYDVAKMGLLLEDSDGLRMSLYRPDAEQQDRMRLKLFCAGDPILLSDALPMLENMGLKVIAERPYRMRMTDRPQIWIQDFELLFPDLQNLDMATFREDFQTAFEMTWLSRAEDDGFNKLVLQAGLDWRQIAMLRGYCRYLLQTGLPYSQNYMAEVLYRNAGITRLLVDRFEALFDPDLRPRRREQQAKAASRSLAAQLEKVASLDEDRILRAFRNVIDATLRTNFYQLAGDGRDKDYISFKLDPGIITELPLPKPAYEIFVYAPRVEGVHLRGGKVARGGLRWSDRREDFRTEVLGLMKAQTVKNTLIVPVGAKGGFVCKRLPEGDREAVHAEVVHCYQTFIRGLLDVTDNLVDDEVIPPERVLRRDNDDYYLVVAADKGTASFSDIANTVAREYDFWLGDAFASGGSAGYDHKGMGITARGAWEAVKRHFRELAVDVQSQEFSVVGIGDMGGDVFGNGMLLSRYIRLKAAFNHQHIFLDPQPDPARSHAERERLFLLPRSSWEDYDPALISPGGGVFSRQLKSIPLSPQVREMLDTQEEELAPQALIRTILKMPVDLLWNGGIGTYVKASFESHADVGDRANDQLRVDARDLRCKVIGEGGNLGLTQLARIEYGLADGRINADFIDNSAGVDTSDREVNIKILLSLVGRRRPLTENRRNRLLEAMTDEVAQLVLRNNYLQTQAISMMENHAVERLNEHAFVLRALERSGKLDRSLEFLPNDEDILERNKLRKGFSRPELSLLVSYSKIALYESLIASDVPDDRYCSRELQLYFPRPLQRLYSEFMPDHTLSREIIATLISNSIVNRMGPVFVLRLQEETGADISRIARAYAIVREVFSARSLWSDIEALDNVVHANVQYSMMFQSTRLLRHATQWLLNQQSGPPDIEAWVERLKPGVSTISRQQHKLMVGAGKHRFDDTTQLYLDIGVPGSVAERMAGLPAAFCALDIVEVARKHDYDLKAVAATYFELGMGLGLDWIREQIENLQAEGRWQAIARGTLRENLYTLQRRLTDQVLARGGEGTPRELVVEWLDTAAEKVSHSNHILAEMRTTGVIDFPTLSVALQEIRKLARID